MVGEAGGPTESVAWVQDARRAAARDLLDQLAQQPLVDQIVVVSPEPLSPAGGDRVHCLNSPAGPVHVGRYLAKVTEKFQGSRLLYFGGGSAPLLSSDDLAAILTRLARTERGIITNNHFATDWAGLAPVTLLADWRERLPKDNMIAWVLSTEAGLPVHTHPPTAANRLDIDTPTDLLALRLHPGARPHLRRYLAGLPLDTDRLEAALDVLARPASRVFIAGRIGPEAWLALNRVTRCWIRVISEERGMASSGRRLKGEVYSLLAEHIDVVGLSQFFARLASQADAAFIDTRVLLAHHQLWPPEAERFASDLGLPDQIGDGWLREFTVAALKAPIPVVLGGHGLMAGDILAFCELL
jgi:CTP:molybdopterin cytidylyltransferase MocA